MSGGWAGRSPGEKRFNDSSIFTQTFFIMKKIYLMWAVAAVAMTGCSKSEVVDQAPDAQTGKIGFMSHVSNSTRAIDATSFNQFKVYGSYQMPSSEAHIAIFNNTTVSKGADGWKYAATDADLRYWIEKGTYTFAAYGIEGNALPTGANANFRNNEYLNLTGYTCDGTNQNDLVYATKGYGPALATGNPVVSMDFKHILSRIQFVFKNSFPEGYKIAIDDFKVVNVRNRGNFYGSRFGTNDNPWVNPNPQAGEYEEPGRQPARPEIVMKFPADGDVAESGATATSDFAYVIPFNYKEANVHIEFRVAVTHVDGDTEVAIFDKTFHAQMTPAWVTGHQYRYTVNLSGSETGLDPIVFSGSVSDWNDVEDGGNMDIDAGNIPVEGN